MTKTKTGMKKIKCPDCGLTLGVPSKVLGSPFECPKCKTAIDPEQDRYGLEGDLPFPDLLPSPSRKSSSAAESKAEPEAKPARKRGPELRPVPESTHAPESGPERKSGPASSKSKPDGKTRPGPEPKNAIAKIIRAKAVETLPGNESDLPTLLLKDEQRKGISTREIRKAPVFLAILVASSILSSGLIILFSNQQAATTGVLLDRTRTEISQYYHTRVDIPLKPYQLELREAQLAHSRGDRKGEVEAYRKVMVRFHAEDRNQFVGVTGSPTADSELEVLVSTMLRGK